MSNPEVQTALMKLLLGGRKHFPVGGSGGKQVKLMMLVGALKKMSCETATMVVFENLTELKGRGHVNTIPKILLREEAETAEFKIWLTPLGESELQRKLND